MESPEGKHYWLLRMWDGTKYYPLFREGESPFGNYSNGDWEPKTLENLRGVICIEADEVGTGCSITASFGVPNPVLAHSLSPIKFSENPERTIVWNHRPR